MDSLEDHSLGSHLSHLPSLLQNPLRHPLPSHSSQRCFLELLVSIQGVSRIHSIPFLSVHPHSPVGGKMSPTKKLGWESNLGLLLLNTLIKIPILLN